jgi:hypothetical protein
MKTLSADTSPEAERVQIELIRQTPGHQKLVMLAQMNQTLYTLAFNGLRHQYPNASREELRRRMADIWLGDELAARVYGPLVSCKEGLCDID